MVSFKIENLSFAYPNSGQMLKNISFEVGHGEFVLLCGKSGSGKTTLLRILKPALCPNGKKSGKITFFGNDIDSLPEREAAARIGFIMQDPEFQIVTDTVRSELAFGLQNLGLPKEDIQLRIAETASYFSLSSIIDKKTSELSGGQKQLLCLAAVTTMDPQVIILDEPASQLDPIASENLIRTLQKLCRESGITIIMTEHRIENIISAADRLLVIDGGELIYNGSPENIKNEDIEKSEHLKLSMPVSARIHSALSLSGKMPLTVADGRQMIDDIFKNKQIDKDAQKKKSTAEKELAVSVKDLWYAYENSGYVFRSLELEIKKGSFFALMGENAAGKTTAVNLMSGIFQCKRGKIKLFGKDIKKYKERELYRETVGVLPQKCSLLFAGPTVKEDLQSVLKGEKIDKAEAEEKIKAVAQFCRIEALLDRHPYDISGGELQRAALAMVLLRDPKIIFLDEPTKGMDNVFKLQLAQKIKSLCQSGKTVIMVSHDTEFCAKYCDECALIFDGRCALQKEVPGFFAGNSFYTTGANKIIRHVYPDAVCESEVLELCKKAIQKQSP